MQAILENTETVKNASWADAAGRSHGTTDLVVAHSGRPLILHGEIVGHDESPDVLREGRNTVLYCDFKRLVEALENIADKLNSPAVLARSMPNGPDIWMTVADVADYLKLSPRAIRDGATSGRLPAHKYPAGSDRGQWRFRRDELDKQLSRKPKAHQMKEISIWR
jgi:excisionase family DNA binding protein